MIHAHKRPSRQPVVKTADPAKNRTPAAAPLTRRVLHPVYTRISPGPSTEPNIASMDVTQNIPKPPARQDTIKYTSCRNHNRKAALDTLIAARSGWCTVCAPRPLHDSCANSAASRSCCAGRLTLRPALGLMTGGGNLCPAPRRGQATTAETKERSASE